MFIWYNIRQWIMHNKAKSVHNVHSFVNLNYLLVLICFLHLIYIYFVHNSHQSRTIYVEEDTFSRSTYLKQLMLVLHLLPMRVSLHWNSISLFPSLAVTFPLSSYLCLLVPVIDLTTLVKLINQPWVCRIVTVSQGLMDLLLLVMSGLSRMRWSKTSHSVNYQPALVLNAESILITQPSHITVATWISLT